MNSDQLLKRLRNLQDDALCYAGCSHEDALQSGLEDIAYELGVLAAETQTSLARQKTKS